MTWIQTFTGRRFDLASPDANQVYLEDIAHSLSMQCRYNGHCANFYSVGEHSPLVAAVVAMDKLSKLWLPRIGYSPTGDAMFDAKSLVDALGNFTTCFTRQAAPARNGLSESLYGLRLKPSYVLEFAIGAGLDTADLKEIRSGLLHDAPEAYVHDLPSPLKRMLADYKAIEKNVERIVFQRYGLLAFLPLSKSVHAADTEVLFVEKEMLLMHELEGWGHGLERHPVHEIYARALPIQNLQPGTAEWEFNKACEILGVTEQ